MICHKCNYDCAPEFNFCPRCGALLATARTTPPPLATEGQAPAAPPTTTDVAGLTSPLIGRQTELDTLQARVRDVAQGRGSVVNLIGEEGVGKSRLVAELRKVVRLGSAEAAPLWLEGRALSYSETLPYSSWLDLLQDWLESDGIESEAETRRKLRQQVDQLTGEAAEIYPYLATLLSLQLEDQFAERLTHLGVEGLKTQTFLAVRTWLGRLAQMRPLVVVFEDLHWADATSLSLLLYCMPLVEKSPLLLINAFLPAQDSGCWQLRHEAETTLAPSGRYAEIILDRLSPRESDELIHNLMRHGTLPPGLKAKVGARAEGNPLFMEEIIRSLIESGALAYDAQHNAWLTTADVDTLSIPDTLSGLLEARVGRLPDETRQVLQRAAVVGRVFWDRVVTQLSSPVIANGTEQHVALHLDRLQRAGLIRKRDDVLALGAEYIFKHSLTHQAAYNSIPETHRRDYHRQVTTFIETGFADRLEEYYGLLAHHTQRADDVEKSCHYAQLAAQRAADRYANREAIAFYQQALALLDVTDAQSRARHFDLLHGLQAVYARIGQSQAQEAALNEMVRLAGLLADSDRLIEVYVAQAASYLGTDLQQAEQSARSGLRLARVMGSASGEARALLQRAWVDRRLWRKRQAISQGEAALAASRRAGDRRLEGRVLCDLAGFYAFNYDYETALNHSRQALEIGQAVGDQSTVAEARLTVGRNLSALNRHEEAIEQVKASITQARQIGDRRREASCLNALGTAYTNAGRHGEAIAIFQDALALHHQVGDRIYESWIYGNIGWMHIRRGNYEAALGYFHSSRDVARRIENRSVEARALMALASTHRRLGQYAEARRLAQTARAIVPRAGWREIERWALGELSLMAWWQGDFALAVGLAQTALGHAHRQQDLQAIGWDAALLATVHQGWPWFESVRGRGSLPLALRLAAQAEESGRQTHDRFVRVWGGGALSLVHWQLDQREEALTWSRRTIELLDTTPGFPDSLEPLYFEHSLVLRANGQQAEADTYLQRARIELMRKADLVTNPAVRRTFLEQVPVNRAIQGLGAR